MVEKAIDQQQLQSEFIDEALNHAYRAAVAEAKVRPVLPPKVSVTKFVPFSTLEFTADVEVLGKMVLADYKKLKMSRPKAKVSSGSRQSYCNMRRQMATRQILSVRPRTRMRSGLILWGQTKRQTSQRC